MVNIIEWNVDFYEEIRKNSKPIIVWGASDWGRFVAEEGLFKISCFCDRNKKVSVIDDIPVWSVEELNEIYKKQSVIVVNSIGTSEIKQASVYATCCSLDMEVDLYNIHNNIAFLGKKDYFEYRGKKYKLFSHLHNCGFSNERRSERSVEVALAFEWIKGKEKLIEIGAVTPYYYPGLVKDIVDPADEHINVNNHNSIFDVDLRGKNVLCLSTVEHIGTGQYGLSEKRTAVMAIEKILQECQHCLITTPLGENELIDQWLRDNYQKEYVTILERGVFGNIWNNVNKEEFNFEKVLEKNQKIREIYKRRKLLGGNNVNIIIEK